MCTFLGMFFQYLMSSFFHVFALITENLFADTIKSRDRFSKFVQSPKFCILKNYVEEKRWPSTSCPNFRHFFFLCHLSWNFLSYHQLSSYCYRIPSFISILSNRIFILFCRESLYRLFERIPIICVLMKYNILPLTAQFH